MKNQETKNNVIDILNRDNFINQSVQLIKSISSHKGNSTFAINGEWGCGKTFVLDKIEDRLLKDSSTRFFVVHYNCWQYDFYEEPLVAIVSVLQTDATKTDKINNEIKNKIKEILISLTINTISTLIKYQTGLSVKDYLNKFVNFLKSLKNNNVNSDYDELYNFRKALLDIKEVLKCISANHTIVFVVDELDRCLPEYAIKVLERLHHISCGIENMITIVAIDKKKLNHTVSSIFGDGNEEEYLKKFIQFEIKLDKGQQDGSKFREKFADFYKRFDEKLFPGLEKEKEFIEELFHGIDARSQERIIEKASLFNDICFGTEVQDYSMMCMELFISTFYYYYGEERVISNDKSIQDLEKTFDYEKIPESFGQKESGFYLGNKPLRDDYTIGVAVVIEPNDIFMLVLSYWYNLPGRDRTVQEKYVPTLPKGYSNSLIGKNLSKLRSNINIWKIIK